MSPFAQLGPVVFIHHLVFYLETFTSMTSPSISLVLKVFLETGRGVEFYEIPF